MRRSAGAAAPRRPNVAASRARARTFSDSSTARGGAVRRRPKEHGFLVGSTIRTGGAERFITADESTWIAGRSTRRSSKVGQSPNFSVYRVLLSAVCDSTLAITGRLGLTADKCLISDSLLSPPFRNQFGMRAAAGASLD